MLNYKISEIRPTKFSKSILIVFAYFYVKLLFKIMVHFGKITGAFLLENELSKHFYNTVMSQTDSQRW